MDVKDLLKERRIALGLSMKELAERVGVSEATISRWESGDIENMKRDKIAKLSEVLGIPALAILGIDDEDDEVHFYFYDDPVEAAMDNLKDRPELQALLDASRNLSPDAVEKFVALINSINEGTYKEE